MRNALTKEAINERVKEKQNYKNCKHIESFKIKKKEAIVIEALSHDSDSLNSIN